MRPTTALLDDAVSAARRRLEAAFPGQAAAARPIAVGWATVEAERAEAELAAGLGEAIGPFIDGPDDALLGGRCRTAPGGPAGFVVAMEPATEGRLAEALARAGEGPLIVWFALATMPGEGLSAAADGPFGPERLVLGGPRGHHLLLIDGPTGTIPT